MVAYAVHQYSVYAGCCEAHEAPGQFDATCLECFNFRQRARNYTRPQAAATAVPLPVPVPEPPPLPLPPPPPPPPAAAAAKVPPTAIEAEDDNDGSLKTLLKRLTLEYQDLERDRTRQQARATKLMLDAFVRGFNSEFGDLIRARRPPPGDGKQRPAVAACVGHLLEKLEVAKPKSETLTPELITELAEGIAKFDMVWLDYLRTLPVPILEGLCRLPMGSKEQLIAMVVEWHHHEASCQCRRLRCCPKPGERSCALMNGVRTPLPPPESL